MASLALRHKLIERNAFLLFVLTLVVISIGGIVEIVPLFTIESTIEHVTGVRPYSPLELAGRDIYVREGCYLCHSQQVRPLRDEVERYGHYSLAAESMYDHPFLWGSERQGPDLARVGGKYSTEWQVAHLKDPRDVVPESIMPSYGFLSEHRLRVFDIADHLATNRIVGVPYSDEMIAKAKEDLYAQLDPNGDSSGLLQRYPGAVVIDRGGKPEQATEMDALVAYLQMLGTMVKFRDVGPTDLKQ
jgi:cytochrome c oxidase cbb3-type subunit II